MFTCNSRVNTCHDQNGTHMIVHLPSLSQVRVLANAYTGRGHLDKLIVNDILKTAQKQFDQHLRHGTLCACCRTVKVRANK